MKRRKFTSKFKTKVAFEALKTQYQQSLSELENLYGTLSQKAFKGELTLAQNHAHP